MREEEPQGRAGHFSATEKIEYENNFFHTHEVYGSELKLFTGIFNIFFNTGVNLALSILPSHVGCNFRYPSFLMNTLP